MKAFKNLVAALVLALPLVGNAAGWNSEQKLQNEDLKLLTTTEVGVVCSTKVKVCLFVIKDDNCPEDGAPAPMVLNSEKQFGVVQTICGTLPAPYQNNRVRILQDDGGLAGHMYNRTRVRVAYPDYDTDTIHQKVFPFDLLDQITVEKLFNTPV